MNYLAEVTIPTGERPSGDSIIDGAIELLKNPMVSTAIAVIILTVIGLMVVRTVGSAVVSILGKLVVPIGILIVAVLAIAAKGALGH